MKKNYFRVLKLSVLTVLLLSFVSTVKAQTFVCTGVSFHDTNITDRKKQETKKEALGSICVLEFYDNTLKATLTENSGDPSTLIFDKINDSKYQVVEYSARINGVRQSQKAVIELQKWVAYIKSFTISFYQNEKLEFVATFKRK